MLMVLSILGRALNVDKALTLLNAKLLKLEQAFQNMSRQELKIAIISGSVGKTAEDVAFSFVFDEAYRLSHRGVQVHVVRQKLEKNEISCGIYFHDIGRKLDAGALFLTLKNISAYPPISLLRCPVSLYWENLYALNVAKVIKDNDIDLIHSHFAYPEGLVGLLAKRRTKKPLIITVHGYDMLSEPLVKYGLRLHRSLDAVIRKVVVNADAVIAASTATYREALKIVNETNRVYLIPNGVDTQRFNPNLHGSHIRKKLNIGGSTIVFTLRAHEPKYGLEYLIRAAPLVLRERKDVIFIIGGSGSLKNHLQNLAVKLDVKEKVMFVGWLAWDEVPQYYAMSDIVVVPSLQEAFGLVVSEALACGKPVIGTNVGGIPDQIIDGYNGFLVKPRDPQAIAERIIYLIDNPDKAKRMGMNGRKIVEEKFSVEKRIDRIIGLYKRILDNSSDCAQRTGF